MRTSTTSSAILAALALAQAATAQSPTSSNTFSGYSACSTSADSIVNNVPVPTSDMALFTYFSEFLTNPSITDTADLCAITNPPQAVASGYSSYTEQLSSWASAEKDTMDAFFDKCKGSGDPELEVSQLLTAVDIYTASGCSGGDDSGSGSATPTPTNGGGAGGGAATGTPAPTGTPGSTTQPGAAAGGLRASYAGPVAAVAAGVVGAAALF